MTATTPKKAYFFSDAHLGIPNVEKSREREKRLVRFLDSIKHDVAELYIMGDLFDFWFEYKTVVPKGFVRLFGKLAELKEQGVAIHYFKGNHDIWAFSYLQEELGIEIYREPVEKQILGKTFYLAHGDGLGRGDKGYKFIKWVFERKLNQWLFRWLHPDIGVGMGLFWSRRSRYANEAKEQKTPISLDEASIRQSRLPSYAIELLEQGKKIDYFVMGHWHIMSQIQLKPYDAQFIFLGDWISYFSYGVFDGNSFECKRFI